MHVELQAANSTMNEHFSIFLTPKINFFARSIVLEMTETKFLSFRNFSDSPQFAFKFWQPSGVPRHGKQG